MFAFAENAEMCEALLTKSPLFRTIPFSDVLLKFPKSWKTDYRGTLLLCTTNLPCRSKLPFGYAIGTVDLLTIINNPFSTKSFNNKYYWILSKPRFIEPFYVRGSSRLFEVKTEPKYIENNIDAASKLYDTMKLTSDIKRSRIPEKIDICYYYHPIDKYYLLWDDVRRDEKGNPIYPKYTTDIKPPDVKPDSGFIAVFDENKKNWTVCKNEFPHPEPEHFDYVPIEDIDCVSIPRLIEFPNGMEHVSVTSKIYDINDLFCPLPFMRAYLAKLRFSQLIENTNKKIFDLYQQHAYLRENIEYLSTYEYYFTMDEIVHNLKKIFDVLVAEVYLKINILEFINTGKIVFDGIGYLMDESKHNNRLDEVRESLFFKKYKSMYRTINQLDNGLKHEVSNSETDHILGESEPIIFLIKAKRNNYNGIKEFKVPIRYLVNDANCALQDILHERLWEKYCD